MRNNLLMAKNTNPCCAAPIAIQQALGLMPIADSEPPAETFYELRSDGGLELRSDGGQELLSTSP